MPRRRLTHQQSRRIAARQAELRADDGSALPGLVIASHGRRVLVEAEDGLKHSCHVRANLEGLVAGDRVRWQPSEENGVVIAADARDNELRRPDARGRLRTVAANVDLLLIVIAPVPEPHANMIDRYLVAAQHEGIDAALILNKDDLLSADNSLAELLNEYQQLGYPTAVTGRGDSDASALAPIIETHTVVLAGQSGVGKSSLVQRLLPNRDIRIGSLSDAAGKGRHTTTAAELFHLNNGGRLIDSPGIRDFHLTHLPESDVAAGFREFQDFAGLCRFRDCRHRDEKDCAVVRAVAEGQISERRYNSYRNIIDSLSESPS